MVTLTAHRGYRQKYPENTMIAFREALKLDIDAIEMDVRMTSDHEIVVIHDSAIDRTTDKSGIISQLTLSEVKKADAGIKFAEEFKGEQIPSLREFLALMQTRPDIKVLLELKDYPEELGDFAYASCEQTFRLCREYGVWGSDRLVVITFSSALCSWIRKKHASEDITLHGFYPRFAMRGTDKEDPYPYLNEVCIFNKVKSLDGRPMPAPTPLVEREVFENFRLMGIRPCVYFKFNTNEEDYKKALEYGAEGFTCDDPYTCGIILDKLGARKLKF